MKKKKAHEPLPEPLSWLHPGGELEEGKKGKKKKRRGEHRPHHLSYPPSCHKGGKGRGGRGGGGGLTRWKIADRQIFYARSFFNLQETGKIEKKECCGSCWSFPPATEGRKRGENPTCWAPYPYPQITVETKKGGDGVRKKKKKIKKERPRSQLSAWLPQQRHHAGKGREGRRIKKKRL